MIKNIMKPWGGKYGSLPPTYLSLETCVFFTEYQLHSKPNKRIHRPQIPVVLLSSPTPPSAHSLFPCLSLPPIPSPTLVMPQVTHPCSYSCKLLTGGFRQWKAQVQIRVWQISLQPFSASLSLQQWLPPSNSRLSSGVCSRNSALSRLHNTGPHQDREWQQLPVPPVCSASFLFPLSSLWWTSLAPSQSECASHQDSNDKIIPNISLSGSIIYWFPFPYQTVLRASLHKAIQLQQ